MAADDIHVVLGNQDACDFVAVAPAVDKRVRAKALGHADADTGETMHRDALDARAAVPAQPQAPVVLAGEARPIDHDPHLIGLRIAAHHHRIHHRGQIVRGVDDGSALPASYRKIEPDLVKRERSEFL